MIRDTGCYSISKANATYVTHLALSNERSLMTSSLPIRLGFAILCLTAIAACSSDTEPTREAPADFIEDEAYLSAEPTPTAEDPAENEEIAELHDEHEDEHEDHDEHEDRHGGEAHLHGHAELAVSVEGDRLTVTFESPLDSLIGFEHEPTNDAQIAELEALQDTFSEPAVLLSLPERARCEANSISSGTRYSGDHGSLMVEQDFICRNINRITQLDVTVFATFLQIEHVDTVFLSDTNQVAKELSPAQPTLDLD